MKQNYNKEELKRFRSILNYCDTIKFYTLNEINENYASDTVVPFLLHNFLQNKIVGENTHDYSLSFSIIIHPTINFFGF